jgi:hypothetical protein
MASIRDKRLSSIRSSGEEVEIDGQQVRRDGPTVTVAVSGCLLGARLERQQSELGN